MISISRFFCRMFRIFSLAIEQACLVGLNNKVERSACALIGNGRQAFALLAFEITRGYVAAGERGVVRIS